jgi:serine/threonine protein kinase
MQQQVAPGKRIARFEVTKVLGAGAQGAVYLAHDPRLDREVAIKTITVEPSEERDMLVRTLLDEARTVSRLVHPNIVPLYDADEDAGTPFLVFEYVEGTSLAERIRGEGRLPAVRAVEIAIAILMGVGYAHQRGIVHRDLKPANVLLNGENVPRVTDFGIACTLKGAHAIEEGLQGTPRYMAPEYVEQQLVSPQLDVYAVGVMLYEMLTGRHMFESVALAHLMHDIVHKAPEPPSARNPEVDARLDPIVLRALAKDRTQRFPDAASMAQALSRFLDPEPIEVADAPEGKAGTVEFLLRRMRYKSDFPALSETIKTINKTVESDSERVSVLCNGILRDPALTSKLIKLVNSPAYARCGGTVSTISRAVAILGYDGVRGAALSLMLLEHLGNKAQAAALRAEIVASYFSGVVARELASAAGVRNVEEAAVCSMFHGLGRMLAVFYLPEEAGEIRLRVESRGETEAAAATEVLGITYAELGVAVARYWNFPDSIVASMKPVAEPPSEKPAAEPERERLLAAFATELSAGLSAAPQDMPRMLAGLAARYEGALGVARDQLTRLVQGAAEKFMKESSALNLPPLAGSLLGSLQALQPGRARQALAAAEAPSDLGATLPAPVIEQTVIEAECPVAATQAPAGQTVNRHAVLTAGVQDITQTLSGEYNLNDVLRIILETMYRAMGFQHVLLLVRDPRDAVMRSRSGIGEGVEKLVARGYSIAIEKTRDVFYAAVGHAADILVEDIDAPSIKEHIPAWYRKAFNARGFLLFPINVNGKVVALIYADAMESAKLRFAPEDLALLKTLRSQAVLAIRLRKA